jgi:hypothetical protein
MPAINSSDEEKEELIPLNRGAIRARVEQHISELANEQQKRLDCVKLAPEKIGHSPSFEELEKAVAPAAGK